MGTPAIHFKWPDRQRTLAALASLAFNALLLAMMFNGASLDLSPGPVATPTFVPLAIDNTTEERAVRTPPMPDLQLPTPGAESQPKPAMPALANVSPDTSSPSPPEENVALAAAPSEEASAPTTSVEIERVPVESAQLEISDTERAILMSQLLRRAQESLDAGRTQVAWDHAGRRYTAILTREPAVDAMGLERMVADVTAFDDGTFLRTRLSMKRLAFSQFTQVIDRWDPFVQLHDDEIVGRFHTNTQFNMAYDSRTAPKFLGKVTTAAQGFRADHEGRTRDADIFRGGIEARAGRIDFPRELQPFGWAPRDEKARVHEFAADTRILFFADGSYSWREPGAPTGGYRNEPTPYPIYFIAAPQATLYVKGTVSGKVLVYSPERIVIEGHLRYAHDPRLVPDSPDYLGLVSDKNIEIAGPSVIGRGDLEIDAALFARRRFVVTAIDYARTATLTIYGSLSAGTVSATEPRYATRTDYDPRFERVRPPGFPATRRYEIDAWDGRWQAADGP